MELLKIVLTLTAISVSYGYLLVHDAPRKVVKVLTVDNGGRWGDWHGPHFCAAGTYAVGYNMKIEEYQRGGDDTALDGVLLRCESQDGRFGGDVGSGESNWGNWMGQTSCDNQASLHHFITGFQLQVEEYQHGGDDTAANYIKFHCRDFNTAGPEYEMAKAPGHGKWGHYGTWSESCPQSSAVCGIQVKIEKPQGSLTDDTGLNDVKLFCCEED